MSRMDCALIAHALPLPEIGPPIKPTAEPTRRAARQRGVRDGLFGDVAQADVIKLHKATGKVTFLVYDNFDGTPLPELRQRIKVNLRSRWIQVFDHSAEQQLLYFKARFLSPQHPRRPEMDAFSAKLRKLGFDETTIGRGPLRPELNALLTRRGWNENLNPRRHRLENAKGQQRAGD